VDEIMKHYIELLVLNIERNMDIAKKSGALSGKENPLAVIKAVSMITAENVSLTNEDKSIYSNLQHFL